MYRNQFLAAYPGVNVYNNSNEKGESSGKEQRVIRNEDQPYFDERQYLALEQVEENSCAQEKYKFTIDEGFRGFRLYGSLIGMKGDLWDIYNLYCEHARKVGFRVRKASTKYGYKGKPVSQFLVCSCEGTKKESSINKRTGKKRASNIMRTNCKASLMTKMNDYYALFEVIDHTIEHNHPLFGGEQSDMHHSQRSIIAEKAVVFEDRICGEMRPMDSFQNMVQDAEDEDLLGHTKKDHLNFVNKLKMSAIEAGDAQMLINILHQQGVEDREFFFRVKLDDEGRLFNVFWRDSMMKEDYGIYGDVVVFDTTFRTNKYNLICAPFVGINNHRKNVMFGCAFIANEKIESFEWLFEVFKKSMEGQCPVTIFTDQDQAIASAIERVFPTTRHKLCIWHLYQNAPSLLGKLRLDKCFGEVLHKCLIGCTNIEEFEQCWSSMISVNGLQKSSWFQSVYSLREKWCNAYNKDFFSAGILSSQRSEITNSTLGFDAKKITSLNDLYAMFHNTLKRWRRNEANDEFQCSIGKPRSCLPLKGLVGHAAEVYTHTVFKNFEIEFVKSISTSFTSLSEDHDTILYNVIHFGRIFHVRYCAARSLISCTCSCKRFEECGLLCCHILRILHAHSVDQIPQFYIKKRWTKVAKQDLWDKSKNSWEKSTKCVPWRHQIARRFYNTALKAQENEDDRLIIEDGFKNITSSLEASMVARQTKDAMQDVSVSSSLMNVANPSHSFPNKRKYRSKGCLQDSEEEEEGF